MISPDMTVRDTREVLARMLGMDVDDVGHYALSIETRHGLAVSFCCDDRQQTASLLRDGADTMLSAVGFTVNDRPPPPMPTS